SPRPGGRRGLAGATTGNRGAAGGRSRGAPAAGSPYAGTGGSGNRAPANRPGHAGRGQGGNRAPGSPRPKGHGGGRPPGRGGNRSAKSRATLALLQERADDVEVINYLDTPPTATELVDLLKQLGMTARQLLRSGEAEYTELGLDSPSLDDQSLIAAMVAHPRLIER